MAEAVDCPPLRGRGLRFVLVDYMMKRPEATVAELVAAVANAGFEIAGRPSKVISDALRWEVRRGRVIRLGRGRYRYNTAPPSTARRIRLLAVQSHAWIAAVMRNQTPPNTPRDPRAEPWRQASLPMFAPWRMTGWLWSR